MNELATLVADAGTMSPKTTIGLGIMFIGVCLACVAFVNSTISKGPVARFAIGALVVIVGGATLLFNGK